MWLKNKQKISKKNFELLLIELNKIVEETAEQSAYSIKNGNIYSNLIYPPNCGLSASEKNELNKLKNNDILESALRKVFADCSGNCIFMFLSLIDQISDPTTGERAGQGICLSDITENYKEPEDMFHDGFFEKYRERKKTRNKDWKLDNL